jgi:YfiH family protein
MSFYFAYGNNILFLKSTLFQGFPLRHAFGVRSDPEFNHPAGQRTFDPPGEDPGRPPIIGDGGSLDTDTAAWLRQIHSNRIIVVGREGQELHAEEYPGGTPVAEYPPAGDALVTNSRRLWLSIQTADCLPVLFYAPEAAVVAAVHSGWRGTLGLIARQAVEAMAQRFGARTDTIRAAVGPGIGGCCYFVSPDLADDFERRFPGSVRAGDTPGGNPRLSLGLCVTQTLAAAGVEKERIDLCPLCTNCSSALFHSYRRDGEGAGRLYSGILLREDQEVCRL